MTDTHSPHHLNTLRTQQALSAREPMLTTLVQIAAESIAQGETQVGADVLAFILRCEDIPAPLEDQALDLWEDLERWVCPRVLWDAREFGKKAYLDDVVTYVLLGA
ncbi:MAG: hypothetical protein ACFE0Q_08655 [Anaerolineae bacterium]